MARYQSRVRHPLTSPSQHRGTREANHLPTARGRQVAKAAWQPGRGAPERASPAQCSAPLQPHLLLRTHTQAITVQPEGQLSPERHPCELLTPPSSAEYKFWELRAKESSETDTTPSRPDVRHRGAEALSLGLPAQGPTWAGEGGPHPGGSETNRDLQELCAPHTSCLADATIPWEVGVRVTRCPHQQGYRVTKTPKVAAPEDEQPLPLAALHPSARPSQLPAKGDTRHSGSCSSHACAGCQALSLSPLGRRTPGGR